MKRSSIAPTGANKGARVPLSDRASRSSHLEEGPALRVAGAFRGPARAAALLEPPGSPPSPFFTTGGCHA